MRPRAHIASPFALALAVALGALGCNGRRGSGGASNEAVMATLGTVRALHHQADVFENAGDFARARGAVERVLQLSFPPEMAEREDLRLDATGRLAELDLRLGDADGCIARATQGLAEARRESVLQARLMMVRGQCASALADRAQAAQNASLAARHRERALSDLEQSIAVNTRVLRRALGPQGAR